jgi:hypothetical protein
MSRQNPVREYLAKIGRKGGKAKVKKGFAVMPKEERVKIQRQGNAARWAGHVQNRVEPFTDRQREARELYNTLGNYGAVGEKLGITRQAVHQLLNPKPRGAVRRGVRNAKECK